MFQLGGVAGYLFRPMAEAVVFALIGSFILSRTLVPTMANYLMRGRAWRAPEPRRRRRRGSRNPLKRFQQAFERALRAQYATRYRSLLVARSRPSEHLHRRFPRLRAALLRLWPFLGENFFPSVDSGQILMHVRAQPGTRIEETARLFDFVEQAVRQAIPADQIDNIVDNIGLPFSGINMAYQNTGTIGPGDGDALISLKEDHAPTDDFIKQLRTILPQKFPGTTFSFLPADIVSQILNFGLPAPIDVQVVGNDQKANYAYATDLLKRIRRVPGIADLRIQQVFNYPQINVDVDRTLAGEVGLTQRDVANSLLVTLSGSGQVHPNFWLNTRERRVLSDRRADAAIPHRHDVGSCQRSDHVGGNRDAAISGRPRADHAGAEPRRRLALQRPAGHRYLRRRAGTRSRRRRRRHRAHPRTRRARTCRAAPTSRCAARCTP